MIITDVMFMKVIKDMHNHELEYHKELIKIHKERNEIILERIREIDSKNG